MPASLLGSSAGLAPRIQKYRRLRCAIDVEVRADLVSENCRSHDLSASGMFVDAAHDYVPGMVVELRFVIDSRPFDLRARIVHVRQHVGFGTEFLDLDRASRTVLLRFVHRERATREAERLIGAR